MVIREVTAKQEASEAKLVEERTADLKKVNAIFFKEFEMWNFFIQYVYTVISEYFNIKE